MWGVNLFGQSEDASKPKPVVNPNPSVNPNPNAALNPNPCPSAATTKPSQRTLVEAGISVKAFTVGDTAAEEEKGKEKVRSRGSHIWSHCSGSRFNVRTGPNYKKSGLKAPSLEAFYEVIAFDFYRTSARFDDVKTRVRIPSLSPSLSGGDRDTGSPYVAPMLIINCQMPAEAPSMFSTPEDGEGFSAIFYFAIKPETIAMLKAMNLNKDLPSADRITNSNSNETNSSNSTSSNSNSSSAALRLLVEYFKQATDSAAATSTSTPTASSPANKETSFQGRFKVIGQASNFDKLDLPGFIKPYNGKPVLITKSGTLWRDRGQQEGSPYTYDYWEMDIRVHVFSFLARKGLSYLMDGHFHLMDLEIGIVIEARNEEEMPERIMAAGAVDKINVQNAPRLF